MRLFELSQLAQVLIGVWIVEILIPLPYGKKHFTTFISQLRSLLPKPVVVVYVCLSFLSLLWSSVINEEVRAILSVSLSLFHPDCAYPAVLFENLLNILLRGQFGVD
jgi:integral membrane sensor domain MASE1